MPDLLDLWTQRLRDSDIAVRREAIRQLELLGDPRALGALAALFALDPDLETRKLAQAAGKAIYQAAQRRIATESVTSTEADRRAAAEILQRAQAKRQGR
jgi:HEAT repeat protein